VSAEIEPRAIAVPDEALADLRERLNRTRWPSRETVEDERQGARLERVRALVDYWRRDYDWRRWETQLNALGSSTTTIDGLAIHFLHVRSPEADALPLVMTHGWPSSVAEFRKVIGPLTDPAAHGGDPADAFHLVLPTIPGFGFTEQPRELGWMFPRIAEAWGTLMERLDYGARWGAQGGDLGAAVTDQIGRKLLPGCVGIHQTFAMFFPTESEVADATAAERAMLADAEEFWDTMSGYAKEQQTRPQTIGYSLADSPVGLAAWIYTHFEDVCGTPGDAEASFTRDELLDTIMMYWLPNAGPSSARIYWEMVQSGFRSPARVDDPIAIPAGFTMFPREHVRKSERWVRRRYGDVVHFDEPDRGGHFGALEHPDAFVAGVRATFRGLR